MTGTVGRPPDAAPAESRHSTGALIRYALPASAAGFFMFLVDVYLLKFATDTLRIPPATLAVLIWVPRVWDAVSDPVIGYLSDRTRSRFGRRRPWIAAGALPTAAAVLMLWSPPSALEGEALVPWMAVALLVLYTGSTLIDIPHFALGAELSADYHERTRLFGVRRILLGIGSLAAVGAIAAFDAYPGPAGQRHVGQWIGCIGALFVVTTAWACVRGTREPGLGQRALPRSSFRAFRDVLANPHARVLLAVAFTQQAAIAALAAALPYYVDYVLVRPGQSALYIGTVLVSAFAGVPLVLRIAPHYDKRTLMRGAMVVVTLALVLLGFAGPNGAMIVLVPAVVAGLAAAALDTLGPSLQADVADHDESVTGERKEAAYFALWALIAKLSRATALAALAVALDALDFTPGTTQTEDQILGLRVLTAGLPALLYAAGTILFARYRLSQAEHARIRAALEDRRGPASRRSPTPLP